MKPKVAKKAKSKASAALEDMSLDNFLDHMEDDLGDDSDADAPPVKKKKKSKPAEPEQEPVKLSKKKKAKVEEAVVATNGKEKKLKKKKKVVVPAEVEQTSDVEMEEGGGQKDLEREHKKALDKLQVTDPELFAFLKKNDRKLLRFGGMNTEDDGDSVESDEVSEVGEDDLASDSDGEEGKVHELPEKLEVASDESDFEEDEKEGEWEDEADEVVEPGKQVKITLRLVKKWTELLTATPLKNPEIIRTVCRAFNSVLVTVTGETNVIPAFKAEGSAIFNAVVQLCVLHLGNAIKSYLGIANSKGFKNLKKNKKFLKIRSCLRIYFTDLTNLLENVSSVHIMNVMLKHLHQFSSILVCYPTITKPILKRLIVFWSTAEEQSVRVLAFLCILKITHGQMRQFLSDVLKNMYLAYVKNSKFVSPNTLAAINFMRRSLTEMFTLDLKVSYQHVFLYVRQLAIHLRNAIILQKKESFQYIYNWQFVNSLKLWGDVLAATYDSKTLEPLVFPLVSIIHGTIKLNPSAQYFPLRFHCCRMLIDLTARTRVFIPVLPFLLEVLTMNSFNEEHKKLSMKPVNLTCLLRFAPANIQENAYKDAVLDQIYELTLEYLAHESYSLCFPDLAVFPLMNLRAFCKATKVYKYSRKLKTLADKIAESSAHIEKQRKVLPFRLNNVPAIQAWEAQRKAEGTPLLRFYEQFARENEKVKRREANQSEDVADYELPTIKKITKKQQQVRREGPVELFPSDDDDDSDSGNGPEVDSDEADEVVVPKKKKKKVDKSVGKEKQKKAKKSKKGAVVEGEEPEYPTERDDGVEAVDILKDLKLDDWD
uniref:Protein involved in nuclear export of pre-ribosomes n=1 Tax=Culex tarsalis TaxID=7177 RepID=A0A1Q3EXK3_CULTA